MQRSGDADNEEETTVSRKNVGVLGCGCEIVRGQVSETSHLATYY